MNIEVGEYVRTKDGYIAKITEIDHHIWFDSIINKISGISRYSLSEEEFSNLVIKHSKNIIDLIEVSDYVNGKEVIMDLQKSKEWYKSKDDFITCKDYTFEEKEIKSVVTKEQFEGVKYEIK